ncbi:hypothetical protein KG918_003442 [Salmonella enterica]|uniref:hypothetical protein n=1 Tax=Salmonella enterica TaxID=28901 RepID=UPI000B53E494|nr:hypothetical protein [Salmonella enterica]ECC1573925.1 hypothetical protein [Salmonella enterica subsp. diarizonae]ASG84168.1 hypothetical protein LFZ55_15235 [Salmonella enterica subsp. diarizonae serovar 65:c:z str. SA20044251]EBA7038436.1 hypothetical protein [Salmonella enterica]ECO7559533.1 hypothetical protein [Salmonella enterica]EDJ9765797.1 hypothetical protein [Salmonella enterica]
MARYRSGNRWLSASEHEEELSFRWGAGLFLAGAIVTGLLLHSVVPLYWYKPVRFVVEVIPALLVGGVLAYFQRTIRAVLLIAGILAVLAWIAFKLSEMV